MKTKLRGFLTLLLALIVQTTFAQQQSVTGTVADGNGMPLPGVNVIVQGTTRGVQTDFDGKYAIEVSEGEVLVFSYLGMETAEVTFTGNPIIDVTLQPDAAQLEQVVVTALGITREAKSLPYAAQTVSAEELNITEGNNIKQALAGKVAGVEINAQAGSKLGQSGKIRIRGAISLTSDEEPLYVVNGIPTDSPNAIDMSNVATINVLKGPTATALYGQRASNGVIQIVTKEAGAGERLSIQLTSSVTFDEITNLRDYQNLYGKGYSGGSGEPANEFGIFDFAAGIPGLDLPYPDSYQIFDGKRYFNAAVYADESWGARFDGEPFLPWYSYYPDSPYYGQTTPYVAHPDNIKEFYETAATYKNIVSVGGGGENYTARISWTNLKQTGIIPDSRLDKNFLSASFDIDLSDNFTVGMTANYSEEKIQGNFGDGYGNAISGSFNSWFNRGLDIEKLRELQGLKTEEGYLASWNNWGLNEWASEVMGGGTLGDKKAAFWFNPYDVTRLNDDILRRTDLLADIHGAYTFLEYFEASFQVSRNQEYSKDIFRQPFLIEYSASPDLFNPQVNSFGNDVIHQTEDNYKAFLRYNNDFNLFDVSAMIGGNIRKNDYYRLRAWMDRTNSDSGGLILPDVYTYSNSRERIVPNSANFLIPPKYKKQVNSVFGSLSLGYNDLLYLDATVRKDWSSALPADNNGYLYPSFGGSFIFSELLDTGFLTFGKLRGGWAQVGDDVDALAINPTYPLGGDIYNGRVLEYTPITLVDPNIQPAMNTSYEFGIDLRFFNNRLGFNATYYNETREDEIIPITISAGTGYRQFLTNGGESNREGVELSLDADIIQTEDFRWNLLANWATNKTTVVSLPAGLDVIEALSGGRATAAFGAINVVHRVGEEWGQLTGTGFVRDENGNRVVGDDGLYVVETNQDFGSVLPDFTGGFVNTFQYKNISLTAAFSFQKGGKFFSLSEYWGNYTGLYARTARINDRGQNVRVPVSEGGGVHVTGVSPDGAAVDTYVNAQPYFKQFRNNNVGEEYVHDASYFKLDDLALSYRMPGSVVNDAFESASISLVARNVWLISVADDNTQEWDPSVMSSIYGEDGQLPSTRSIGMNIKLTF